MQNDSITWSHKDTWTATLHGKLHISVQLHSKDSSFTHGRGIYCYYLWIYEQHVEDFETWWLPDKQTKRLSFITHDYDKLPLNEIPFHGGITYYAKHGHVVGFRAVELGCDYGHLYDHERRFDYTLDEIQSDALRAAEALYSQLTFKKTAA